MRLLDTESKRVELLGGNSYGAGNPQGVTVDDQLQVDLACIMDVVDNDCHYVLQFEGQVADAIADTNVGDLFHLSAYFLIEEVPLLAGHFRKGITVAIDLPIDGILS